MKAHWILGLLATGFAAMTNMNTVAQVTAPALRVGQPFPNLLFPAADDGRPCSVHQLHGKKTLVHLFASW